MTELQSPFLQSATARGYMHQCTDLEALDTKASAGIVVAYSGFDCTGPSLHVGHLLPIMLLRLLQKSGHKPIVLLGGGTTRIGDPSGKDKSRQMLSDADIASNMASIRGCFEKFLTFGEGPTDAILVDNQDWLGALNYIEFLRDMGPHFTINRMLTFDSVKLRLDREQPLTFLEFNYMILQAYDFLELYKRQNCTLQLGGSDQWGNIVNGVELIRRVEGGAGFGLTVPLITTASGQKMGKTEKGAVWLNEDMLSSYDYWQFWRNCEDADVGRFLRLFTELPERDIAELEAREGAELNEAKKILANEATTLLHGANAAALAAETARKTFEEGGAGGDLPEFAVPREELENGIAAFDLLHRCGLTSSRGEARRLVKNRGARANNDVIESEMQSLSMADMVDGKIKLSAGKKRHVMIVSE